MNPAVFQLLQIQCKIYIAGCPVNTNSKYNLTTVLNEPPNPFEKSLTERT